MSVRMALAKLCACACGGAVIGGGAVHVAERPAHVRYAKVRQVKPVRRVAAHRPLGQRRVRNAAAATNCAPVGTTAFAARAAPPYSNDPSGSATGDPAVLVGGAGGPVTGGGMFNAGSPGGGGYYPAAAVRPSGGGASGGTGAIAPGGGTATGTGGGTATGTVGGTAIPTGDPKAGSGGTGSTGTNDGGVGTSHGGGGTVTTGGGSDPKTNVTPSGTGSLPPTDRSDPTPVPAPPMLLLFGAAAAALIARRQIGRRTPRD